MTPRTFGSNSAGPGVWLKAWPRDPKAEGAVRKLRESDPRCTHARLMFNEVSSVCVYMDFGACCQRMLGLNNFLLAKGFSIKPLKVKLLAGEQKATE